jgi:hypothetical protein
LAIPREVDRPKLFAAKPVGDSWASATDHGVGSGIAFRRSGRHFFRT